MSTCVDRHAELLGDDLREGGLVALAVAVRAGEHRDAAGRMHPHVGDLVESGAGAERPDDAATARCRRPR